MSAGQPALSQALGTVIDERYRLFDILGEGGMGTVYRAQQLSGGPDVAIKVLRDELGDDADQRARFEREAAALFGMQHPNILVVHDFGIVRGKPYLVMELLEGSPLDALLEQYGPPDAETTVSIAQQILRALAFAHGQGAVHRDMKTENVFVARGPTPEPVVKLLDFGLVKFTDQDRWGAAERKLTRMGMVFGTPAYMAPEQAVGAPTDARSDVYSAGVVLFELLTGTWPFVEESEIDMARAHMLQPAPALAEAKNDRAFHPELEAVVKKALAKKPEERFQDAREMLSALEAVPRPWFRAAGASTSWFPPPVAGAARAASPAAARASIAGSAIAVWIALGLLAFLGLAGLGALTAWLLLS